jgi:hypothetical protein
MREVVAFILVSLVVMGASGCDELHEAAVTTPSPIGTIGSGQFVTESRAVRDFDTLAINAGGRAVVTQGDVASLEITAEDNILPLIESTVVNGRLTLSFRSGSGSISSRGVTYRVGMRDIRGLIASAGSRIEAHAVDTSNLDLQLSAGSVFVGSGSAQRFALDISAGSRVDAPALHSRVAVATLAAGSLALVRVTDSLAVTASAGSVLEYVGDPVVHAQTSGGSIVRRSGS